MASALVTRLIARRDDILTKLEALDGDDSHHMSYTENGRSMPKTEYQTMLEEKLKNIEKQIADHSPFIVRSRSR